ncbi:hypothetical protein SK128_007570 [Halocaridina rubra]|uniref:Uncharacterized protein n=1 Tax=Halocaridina rubra TaxID=373956 RepID=A0AAN8WZX3_HALRR
MCSRFRNGHRLIEVGELRLDAYPNALPRLRTWDRQFSEKRTLTLLCCVPLMPIASGVPRAHPSKY